MTIFRFALTGFTFLLFTCTVFATEVKPQGDLHKNQQDTRKYYELLKKERELKKQAENNSVIERTEEPTTTKPAAGRTIFVKRFEVSESEVLTVENISQLTDKYVNRKLDISQIITLVNEINQLYATKTQIVARAILPKQKVSDGVIKIQLIESTLGKIELEGNTYTRDSSLRDSISLDTGELIHLNELDENLVSFNRWNDIKLKASLQPGETYGTTDVIVVVDESQQYSLNVFADNAGRETVGENRAGFTMKVASLFGFRDRLIVGASSSHGSTNVWGSYEIPIDNTGTRFVLSYDGGDIEIVDGELKPLNVTGDSSNVGFSVVKPIATERSYDWDLSVGFVRKSSKSYFDDVELVSTIARDVIFNTHLRFFDEYGTWLTSHAITLGDSEAVEQRDYIFYTGSLVRLHYFDYGDRLLVRASWQLSDTDDLPSFDQITVGGMASVRGYTEGLLTGDRGYKMSAEYTHPLGITDKFIHDVNVFAFLDHGAAFPYRGDNGSSSKSEDFLVSIGGGLEFDIMNDFSIKVSYGVPLKNKSHYKLDSYIINAMINWQAW
ncbi:ShlB/FhaC/HecB family hemolysin secretion/activation protein [Candidatus Colwellia aromaticivorans]|uniref:ShlB/FhaC/HecB family hemolysin secretion/activation protein n=1 Tax=Candidatus Colwellia aromaticivorans TaxID=2267621 RepID=UPI000DF312DA|nr:ShlB/FhaC/HecB family hemolysin secretion/activation protein [Candidatus Colwellia aromaticivorans]